MITKIVLQNFKNHENLKLDFWHTNILVWENWSWKTWILEAIYFVNNFCSPIWVANPNLINTKENNFLIKLNIEKDDYEHEIKITADWESRRIRLFIDNKQVTKKELDNKLRIKTVFFSLIEMNLIYLGPSLRRDFLDEIVASSYPEFKDIKSNYQKILKNRNKLLKNIDEWKSDKSELSFWNNSFIKASEDYYKYRLKFIEYIENNSDTIKKLMENKYDFSFKYQTKINLKNISKSISDYLEKNVDRDIIMGKTMIWPHLDDFIFEVDRDWKTHNSDYFLSRWENKTILLGLKFLQIKYLKELFPDYKIITLLDDFFAELDKKHINTVLDILSDEQSFLTAQFLPIESDKIQNSNKIFL